MANSHSLLEFSPITYNLPSILFERMPPWIVSILTKWNSVSIGPQLKVGIFIYTNYYSGLFYIKIKIFYCFIFCYTFNLKYIFKHLLLNYLLL